VSFAFFAPFALSSSVLLNRRRDFSQVNYSCKIFLLIIIALAGDIISGGVCMAEKKTAVTGAIDKDQLGYESDFNPEAVSYVGPRTVNNHNTFTNSSEMVN